MRARLLEALMRSGIVIAALTLALAALALMPALNGASRALADPDGPAVTLLAVDLHAAAETSRDRDVAVSAGTLIAGSQQAGTLALLTYADSPAAVEAYDADGSSVAAIRSLGTAIDGATRGESDQVKAMSAAFQYLSNAEAPAGSRLYVLTSDGLDDSSAEARGRLADFAGLFASQEWSVSVVMLPSASPASREFLTRLARAGAGISYDAGHLEGLATLVSDQVGALGQAAIQTQLADGDSALSQIEVAPRSSRITLTFLRMSPWATFQLFDPRGAMADAKSNPAVSVFETQSAVRMTVDAPEAGMWTLRAAGAGSEVLAAVKIDNPLRLALVPQPPIPAGEAGTLAAAASIDGRPTALPGAMIEATVRGADGKAVVYRLLDDGRLADRVAGDGVFTVTLPAGEAQSINDVGLRLSWANYGAVLTASDSYQIEQFPTVSVVPVTVLPVEQGAETAVSRIEVAVGAYPYPVRAGELSVKVRSQDGASVASRLVAIDPLPDGRSWRFSVVASPVVSGSHSVAATLNVNHLGRDYTASASGNPAPVEILPPPPPPGTPTWVYGASAAGAVAVVLALALAVNARKPVPSGYLYDDKGRMLYDFSMVRPSLRRRLLSRNIVSCADVPGLPVNSGAFVFGRRGVELRHPGKTQNLRVNGRPAGDRVRMEPGTWLGISGRLMTYAMDRRRREQFPAQVEDDSRARPAATPWPATPPIRRVTPGYVPGRPQAAEPTAGQSGAQSRAAAQAAERAAERASAELNRRNPEPPAEGAAPSPAPAGD
jgi:hypothetical protein